MYDLRTLDDQIDISMLTERLLSYAIECLWLSGNSCWRVLGLLRRNGFHGGAPHPGNRHPHGARGR